LPLLRLRLPAIQSRKAADYEGDLRNTTGPGLFPDGMERECAREIIAATRVTAIVFSF